MTYIYRVLREAPSGLWSMDATPVVDSSGYNRHASFTGSPTTTRPIVAGGIASQLLDSGDSVTYPVSNIAVSGRESRSFSLEAWVKPQTGNHKVLARDNSGLFIDGFKLRMSLDFGGTLVSAEYKGIRPGNVYHVVGVYDSTGISLFLNGVKVAGVDIPDETRALGIADTATTLSSSTDTSIVLDSLATYFYPLSYEDVRSHYQQGADYPEVINLSTLNGGKYYEFTDGHVSTYRKSSFPETDAWAEGLFEGTVSVVDDSLVNMYDVATDMYQTGTWTIQESFEVAAGVVLVASRITWNADANITVEKSEDGGTTWTALSNGGQIVSNKSLDIEGYSASIRVTIPASAEQISVSDLTTAFYTSLDAKGSDEDLPAVVRDPASATVAETGFPAAQFNDNAGINLAGASGGLSIAADDAEFGGYFAVEMTVKLSENSANATVLWVDTASAQPQIVTDAGGQWTFANLTALYVDGVSVTSPAAIAPGVWHHVIALFPESLAAIYVGNNVAGTASHAMRIGHLATYSDPVGESDAVAIYKAWTGAPAIQIAEAQVVNVSEKSAEEAQLMMMAAPLTLSASYPWGNPVRVTCTARDRWGDRTEWWADATVSMDLSSSYATDWDVYVVWHRSDTPTTIQKTFLGRVQPGNTFPVSFSVQLNASTAWTAVIDGVQINEWSLTPGPYEAAVSLWTLPQSGGTQPWLGTTATSSTDPKYSRFYIGTKIAETADSSDEPFLALGATYSGTTGSNPRAAITIPAAKVIQTVAGFPIKIDLAHLPQTWWDGVSSGNPDIRVTTSDGVRVPVDIVNIDLTNKKGNVYARVGLTSGADNMFIIEAVNSATPPADADQYGRNAVWADYEAVFVFGGNSMANRTGKSGTMALTGSVSANNGRLRFSGSGTCRVTGMTDSSSWTIGLSTDSTSNSQQTLMTTAGQKIGVYNGSTPALWDGSWQEVSGWSNVWSARDANFLDPGNPGRELGRLVETHNASGTVRGLYAFGGTLTAPSPAGYSRTWTNLGQDNMGTSSNIGFNNTAGSEQFLGAMDRIVFRHGALSASWIAMEHESWERAQNFYSVGEAPAIVKPTRAFKAYSHDWAIVSGG